MPYAGLFYEIIDANELNNIKLAAIYFDKLFILTPVTLIGDLKLQERYTAARSSLLGNFEKTLGFQLPNEALEAEPEVLATLNLQAEARALIKEEVVTIINPFDEIQYLGLKNHVLSLVQKNMPNESSSNLSYTSGVWSNARACEDCYEAFGGRPPGKIQEYSTDNLIKIKGDTLRKIMLHSALLVSAKYRAYPISTDEYIDKKLWKDLVEGVQGLPKGALDEIQRVLNDQRNLKAFRILHEVVAENLPTFHNLSFDEILEVRFEFIDELTSLRSYLRKLATTIGRQDTLEAIASEISDVVTREVNPAIIDLQRKIKNAKQKVSHRILDKLALTSSTTICATVMANVPLWYSPLITSAILGGVVLSETYREIIDIRTSNPMSFILRLNR